MASKTLELPKRPTHNVRVGIKTKRLISKLKHWCDEPGGYGRRMQVATALSIKKQTVTNWFNGSQEPTGEQVLGIQEFMEEQRRS